MDVEESKVARGHPGDPRKTGRSRALDSVCEYTSYVLHAQGKRVPLRLEYVLPLTCGGERDWEQVNQLDLIAMDRDELLEESWRLRFLLSFGDFGDPGVPRWARPWAEERLERIRGLLKRGGNDRAGD